MTLVKFLGFETLFGLPIRMLLLHDRTNLIIKMENKVLIPKLKVVIPFEIFSEAINFWYSELAKRLFIKIELFVSFRR